MPSTRTAYSAILTTKVRKNLEIRKFYRTFVVLFEAKRHSFISRHLSPSRCFFHKRYSERFRRIVKFRIFAKLQITYIQNERMQEIWHSSLLWRRQANPCSCLHKSTIRQSRVCLRTL